MNNVQKIKATRQAARVERMHQLPGLGSYSDGLHTFNMLTMLLVLNQDASPSLIRAVIEHDIPEYLTGDMSSDAKKNGIQNNQVQAQVELEVNENLFGRYVYLDLSDEDKKWLSGLDMLEFYCYCREQRMLGNKMLDRKQRSVAENVKKNKHLYHVKIVDALYEMEADDWQPVAVMGEEL
tara:strand:+ start:376 stop:915 length:540 start_codon:yes stop_codon:yes gene_type:complete